MAGNSFGNIFRITSFGESHGPGIGVVIDGCPAGLKVDTAFIQQQLDRRKPGQSAITSPRKESDEFEILSGIFEEYTTGAPITFFVRNLDQRSEDYDQLKDIYRPGHADLTYDQKYGRRDYRGGGRSSARETVARVIAGSIARQLLSQSGIQVYAYVSQIGAIRTSKSYFDLDLRTVYNSDVRCPDPEIAERMTRYIEELRDSGNTVGGAITCVVKGMIPGLGEPVYDKLQSSMAAAMLGINAAKGFDYGSGFEALEKTGAELNDSILPSEKEKIASFKSNHSGGILGGISTGQDLHFRVAFKPVSTIRSVQQTVNRSNEAVALEIKGRHDPCVLPRAVPVVEAMCALVLADHLLLAKASVPLK